MLHRLTFMAAIILTGNSAAPNNTLEIHSHKYKKLARTNIFIDILKYKYKRYIDRLQPRGPQV